MEKKIVLIFGGSGGIGSATARKFGKEGAKVVLAARNKSKAEEVAKEMMLIPEEVANAVFYAVNQSSGSVLNEVVIQPESHQLV